MAVFTLHLGLLNPAAPYLRWTLRYVLQGGAGVSFFFMLSGFVLTWSRPAGDRAGSFYRRRAARILPNHVLSFFAMGLVLVLIGQAPGLGPAAGSLFLFQAWVPSSSWYWAMNTPAWSLGCEAFFYALFPLLLPALRRLRPSSRRVLLVVAVQLILGVAVLSGPATPGSLGYWLMYFFPAVRLLEFVLGILLALEVRSGALPRLPLRPACLLAVGAYVAAGWAPAGYRSVAVTAVPFGVLLAAAAQRDVGVFARAADRSGPLRRAAVVLGQWSFAFYLVHYPILSAIGYAELHHPLAGWTAASNAVGELGCCVVAAAVVHRFFEAPMERLLRGHRRAAALTATAALTEDGAARPALPAVATP